jgi:hypothetical protein
VDSFPPEERSGGRLYRLQRHCWLIAILQGRVEKHDRRESWLRRVDGVIAMLTPQYSYQAAVRGCGVVWRWGQNQPVGRP